ncbi:MAG: hypothetical protein IPO75_06330 [Betaproteobacteria bacterium]|nr:hypothetical protein [Betaproteobacteria bacterium]
MTTENISAPSSIDSVVRCHDANSVATSSARARASSGTAASLGAGMPAPGQNL